jgi:hypothetical protein
MRRSQAKLSRKTDNRSLADKCSIRELVIREAKLEPLRVLDLYAGESHVWNALRRPPYSLKVSKYTPVDSVARQPGQIRFKTTPRLIAAMNGDRDESMFAGDGLARYNCIDLDVFGDAWSVYRAIVTRIKTRTAVFITRGSVAYGAGRANLSKAARIAMGIPPDWNIPIKLELIEMADKYAILEPLRNGRCDLGLSNQAAAQGLEHELFRSCN